ncbi:MAG TPA: hypothetical protein VFV83_04855 [Chthoniobacteraceae bacterium]|nr:hypothetical protein [Chthoniobacteraceae bacterium]
MNRFLARAVIVSVTVCFALRADVVAGGTRDPSLHCYATAGEVRAMPLRTALVDERSPCHVILIASDGTKFRLGGPGNTPQFAQFLGTLKEGVLYHFPNVFVEFEKRAAASRRK